MNLEKYSFDVGDRFGHLGKAQLNAMIKAKAEGVNIVSVLDKSFQEHSIILIKPESISHEVDIVVKEHDRQDDIAGATNLRGRCSIKLNCKQVHLVLMTGRALQQAKSNI